MAALTASMLLPSKLKFHQDNSSLFSNHIHNNSFRCIRSPPRKGQSIAPKMRLFGPAIFEASKLKVLFLGGVDEEKHPPKLPRTYTLTHSDITAKLTLAISQTINNSQLQGWYNKLYRDEVVAEWKKVKGKMSLHVHCHISGGHFLLDLCARLRYYIFRKELPVVLNAFVHGDEDLFNNNPELQEAMVLVYFHSSIPEFNQVECWGPLREALDPTSKNKKTTMTENQQDDDDDEEPLPTSNSKWEMLETCTTPCRCCFPPTSLITWKPSLSQQHHQQKLPGNVSIPPSRTP